MQARRIAIAFGIAIIFPLLVYYGVATFHPAPKFQSVVTAIPVGSPNTTPNATPKQKKDYDEQRQKRDDQEREYNTAAREFARIQAMISVPLGLAAILIGAYLTISAIGPGLIYGGIFSVVAGYLGYWQHLDDWIRFVSLLAGFLILLFVGYYKVAKTAQTRPDS